MGGLLLDPPHPKTPAVSRTTHASPNANFNWRRLRGMLNRSRQPNRVPPPRINHASGFNRPPTVCGAVVATVRTVVPVVVTEVGDKEQLASLMFAGTAQVKLTAPVNPLVGPT